MHTLDGNKNDRSYACYYICTCDLFLFTHAKLVTNMFCVHVWARQVSLLYVCHVVILSMVVVAFAASVESSLLSSSLLEPRRDRGNRKEMVCFQFFAIVIRKRQNTDIRETSRQVGERYERT